MRSSLRAGLAIALLAGCGDDSAASGDGPGNADAADARADARPLPEGLGWLALPGTALQDACPYDEDPVFSGVEGCSGIVDDWSGGIADTLRGRLLIWGGGHDGYYGNEVYALELGSQQLLRLNDPSPPYPDRQVCAAELEDGTPSSRHTYDGLAYVAHADRMFAFSGAPACGPGGFSEDTWTLDLATLTWQRMDPTNGGQPTGGPGVVADYDAMTRLVYLHDTRGLWTYDYDTNTYTLLRDNVFIDYHLTGRVDPMRRLFVIMGSGSVHVFDLAAGSAYDRQDWTTTGCDPVVEAIYPGLAWEPTLRAFVAWGGGDEVYLFDPDGRSCTAMTGTGGPGPQVENGTNGRWRYFPAEGVFALLNQWDQDSFLFRLSPAP